jgi:hypothetical protein
MDAARRARIEARIAQLDILIDGYHAAMLVFATNGGVTQYTIDTGQSRQTVQRADPASLLKIIESLEATRQMLEGLLVGGNAIRVIPDW